MYSSTGHQTIWINCCWKLKKKYSVVSHCQVLNVVSLKKGALVSKLKCELLPACIDIKLHPESYLREEKRSRNAEGIWQRCEGGLCVSAAAEEHRLGGGWWRVSDAFCEFMKRRTRVLRCSLRCVSMRVSPTWAPPPQSSCVSQNTSEGFSHPFIR